MYDHSLEIKSHFETWMQHDATSGFLTYLIVTHPRTDGKKHGKTGSYERFMKISLEDP